MLHEVYRAWLSRPFSRLRRIPPLECHATKLPHGPYGGAPADGARGTTPGVGGPRRASNAGVRAPRTVRCPMGRSERGIHVMVLERVEQGFVGAVLPSRRTTHVLDIWPMASDELRAALVRPEKGALWQLPALKSVWGEAKSEVSRGAFGLVLNACLWFRDFQPGECIKSRQLQLRCRGSSCVRHWRARVLWNLSALASVGNKPNRMVVAANAGLFWTHACGLMLYGPRVCQKSSVATPMPAHHRPQNRPQR